MSKGNTFTGLSLVKILSSKFKETKWSLHVIFTFDLYDKLGRRLFAICAIVKCADCT